MIAIYLALLITKELNICYNVGNKGRIMRLIAYLVALTLIAGCTHYKETYDQVKAEQWDAARTYVSGASDALHKSNVQTIEIDLATELVDQAEVVLGEAPADKRLDVAALLSENKKLAAKARDALNELKEKDKAHAIELRKAQDKLIGLGAELEAEKNKNIVKSAFNWLKGILGVGTIGGIIALCVIFPPFAGIVLSLGGNLISFLIGAFPKVISFFGVVSKSAFDATVSGVGAIYSTVSHIKDTDPEKKLTAAEWEAIMDKHLKDNQTPKDQHIIDTYRKANNL